MGMIYDLVCTFVLFVADNLVLRFVVCVIVHNLGNMSVYLPIMETLLVALRTR